MQQKSGPQRRGARTAADLQEHNRCVCACACVCVCVCVRGGVGGVTAVDEHMCVNGQRDNLDAESFDAEGPGAPVSLLDDGAMGTTDEPARMPVQPLARSSITSCMNSPRLP